MNHISVKDKSGLLCRWNSVSWQAPTAFPQKRIRSDQALKAPGGARQKRATINLRSD